MQVSKEMCINDFYDFSIVLKYGTQDSKTHCISINNAKKPLSLRLVS